MDATPTSDFYLNTNFSFNNFFLLHDEQMYDVPKALHGVENREVCSWIIQELVIEQVVQRNEGIQIMDSQ